MNMDYIAAWLSDQVDDDYFEFPKDFDFDSAVEQLNEWFDDQLVSNHLDDLLNKLLKEINPKPDLRQSHDLRD